MVRYGFILILVGLLLSSVTAQAEVRKGFHTGPYLALEFGALQSMYDRDQTTGQQVGNDFQIAYGLLFGWNLWDAFSAELQGRYATDPNGGRREYIVGANAFAKWTILSPKLTGFKSLRILPFLKAGLSSHILVLPEALGAGDGTVTNTGIGPSAGAGIAFLWKKYVYVGIDLQEDFLFFDDIRQTVDSVPNTLVYKGGFHPSFSGLAIIGVHY